jgi:hypothetical protein
MALIVVLHSSLCASIGPCDDPYSLRKFGVLLSHSAALAPLHAAIEERSITDRGVSS